MDIVPLLLTSTQKVSIALNKLLRMLHDYVFT